MPGPGYCWVPALLTSKEVIAGNWEPADVPWSNTVTSKCPWPPVGQLSKLQLTVHDFTVTVNCPVVLSPSPVCWSNTTLPFVGLELAVVDVVVDATAADFGLLLLVVLVQAARTTAVATNIMTNLASSPPMLLHNPRLP